MEVEAEEADGPKCEGEREREREREAGRCDEREITGTTRCQDGDKDRAEGGEGDAHKQMERGGRGGGPAPVAVRRKQLCLQSH